MPIAYAAHTHTCTFLLDEEGVCRRVMMNDRRVTLRSSAPHPGDDDETRTARRCVGAQYVASLAASAEGSLVSMPCVGAPMLFAYASDERMAVVRTGPLVRFDSLLDTDSGVRALPIEPAIDVDELTLTLPRAVPARRRAPSADWSDTTLQGARARGRKGR